MKLSGERTITDKQVQEILKEIEGKKISKGAGIRAMFAGGMSVKEISKESGIRYNQVYNVVNNEVLTKGLQDCVERKTGDGHGSKKSQILEMLQSGKTIAETAQELKCLYNQVWQVAKEAGLTKKQSAELIEKGA